MKPITGHSILSFLKKEIVLTAALALALISAFIIPPDAQYPGYIDFHSLAMLFSLMCIMAGLRSHRVFRWVGQRLLERVNSPCSLVMILVMLCFFSSMLITNDVALITFVPFGFVVLRLLPGDSGKKLVIPTVALQTVAANLGSMLTPVGNPQNLYLYGRAGLPLIQFMGLMLPYTLLALALLVACVLAFSRGGRMDKIRFDAPISLAGKGRPIAVYLALFILCLLSIAHVLSIWIALAAVVVAVALTDRKVFLDVDYSLLMTFVGFFIFIGNMGRIPAFRNFLQRILSGHEVLTSVVASQVISNVPAALLLSGFTENFPALIVGTNLGGLGTLIASMASLISYKQLAAEFPEKKGPYFKAFTLLNLLFLAAQLILWWVL